VVSAGLCGAACVAFYRLYECEKCDLRILLLAHSTWLVRSTVNILVDRSGLSMVHSF
jgi:hypothetical protein